jgi:hypothetical protein
MNVLEQYSKRMLMIYLVSCTSQDIYLDHLPRQVVLL